MAGIILGGAAASGTNYNPIGAIDHAVHSTGTAAGYAAAQRASGNSRGLAVVSANFGFLSAALTQLAGYPEYAAPVGAVVAAANYMGYIPVALPIQLYQYQHAIGGASLGYLVGPMQGYEPLVSAAAGGAAFVALAYYLGKGGQY